MQHPGFFQRSGPFTIRELATRLGADTPDAADRLVHDVKTLQDAGPTDAAFFNNQKYTKQLMETKAAVCLVAPMFAGKVPTGTAALIVKDPYRAFADMLLMFYPESCYPQLGESDPTANISPSAVIEDDVVIDRTAVVCAEAHIGRGSRVAAGAIVGYRCTVGRDCYIGPRVTLMHTLMGDRVSVHSGASIGQDGFGFAMGPGGHKKVPQIGRVIIQDDVEIGANSTIDRGALNDTFIGEGTKIDNLVQIGHNVIIGRHCVIVAMAGVAGSCELGDFVVMAGKSGLSGHLKVGAGAQIAGASHPIADVPAGAKMGGTPARPYRQWAREQLVMRRLVKEVSEGSDG